MTKPPTRLPRRPAPVQLPLFAEAAFLPRVRPEHRFYRLDIRPDLFGRALLIRHWGHPTPGSHRHDPHPDPGAALNALARLLHAKQRRGYRPVAAYTPESLPVKAARTRALPSRSRQDAARLGPGTTQGAAVRPMKPALAAPPAKPPTAKLPSRTVAGKSPAASPKPQAGMALHTATGARKYLTAGERDAFLRQANLAERPVRTLCMTLAYAGCRLSEALALTADRVDLAAGVLVFESLKKRRNGIYRTVPVPPALLQTLDMVHGIRESQSRRGKGRQEFLWPWSRMTGWRAAHAVMAAAGLDGTHASPKGLRHGFGVAAVSVGIPLNLVQKWLGHAHLSTTAIYADTVGAEEQDIAQRMWQ